ncbi:MAG: hypothetical protein F6K31_31650 [Symploca sp. SIO2G7]|nr:hypothetical protein [Symploca sp. SIO2G7]
MLAGTQPSSVNYDSRAGQYRRNGRFVSRATVLKEVDKEVARTEVRLQAITRKLIAKKVDLPTWEEEFAIALKEAHIRSALFAAGGKDEMFPRAYGHLGANLRTQYRSHLDKFAHSLANGDMTAKQALNRSKLYGQSVRQTFFDVERVTREKEGFTLGKRSLDPQAQHCPSCLRYVTDGWVGISDIVAPGTACECRGRCRCRVVYARLRDFV